MSFQPIPQPVLVTGAGGLIGSTICQQLHRAQIAVRALLAPEESAANLEGLSSAIRLRGDVRDIAALIDAARGCGSIIHAAALNKLWHKPARDFYAINVEGTKNACRAAMQAGVSRFIFTSSCEVFGPASPEGPADEHRLLSLARVRGHYERSKFLAETCVKEMMANGLCAIIIRPTAVLGPGDIHGTPPGLLVRAYLAKRIPVYYDAGINIVDARDVAHVHIRALTADRCGETYIAGGHNLRLSELFSRFAQSSDIPPPTRTVGYRTAMLAAWMRQSLSAITGMDPGATVNGVRTVRYPWFFDASKAQRELGLAIRPIEETVRDAIAWHRSAPCCPTS